MSARVSATVVMAPVQGVEDAAHNGVLERRSELRGFLTQQGKGGKDGREGDASRE